MALVVEDGSGLADANAYAALATVNAYHTARANAAWTGTDAAKEAAIIRATELLDASFAWRGEIATEAQALRFPRSGLTDRDGREIAADALPTQIQKACCELAALLIAGAGVGGDFGSTSTATGAVKRIKAGPTEIEFAAGQAPAAPASASNVLPDGAGELLDRILFRLFTPPGGPMIVLGKS